jgi:uncharacterized protein (TIGR02453 family)
MATLTRKRTTTTKKAAPEKKAAAPKAIDVKAFEGFPKKGLQFLRELKDHQDRDWFRDRKDTYEEFVRLPMEYLVTEVAAACRKRGFPLYAKEKNPVMRVYRDVRFSPNKDPFNTHVGAGLKRSAGKVGHGEVYIHVSTESSFVAAGFWMPERPFINAWRAAMDRDPEKFLKVVAQLKKSGLEMGQEKPLVRMPRGYEQHAGTPIEPFFKLVSYTSARQLKTAEYQSPNLVEVVVDFALAVKPLLEFGWALNFESPRDVLDERF